MAWSMWKPDLSAANIVRLTLMPPKARTLTVPSGSRLQGQPQCSSWISSFGASWTKYSTTSWSAMKSLPLTVSAEGGAAAVVRDDTGDSLQLHFEDTVWLAWDRP